MRIFISTLLIALILLSSCTHKQKEYTDLISNWQEKAQEARTRPIRQRQKTLTRETVISNTEQKTLIDEKLPKKNITVKYYQQDLSSVMRSMGKLAGLNTIVDDSLVQKVTMEITDTPWNEVFKGLLESYSLEYVYENNIVRIVTPDSIKKRLEAETVKEQLNQAKLRVQKSSPLLMRTIKLDHLDIESTANIMRKILSEEKTGSEKKFRGSVETDKTTNTVIINAVAEDINKMLDLVEKLDKPAVQVLIEAQIVIADQSTARELGMQWGGLFKLNDHSWVIPGNDESGLLGGPLGAGTVPNSGSISNFPINSNSQGLGGGIINQGPSNGLNIGIGYVDSNMILQAQLSALEEAGQAHIVSSPTITTLNNIQAYIESGSEIPYQSSSDNTGTNTEFKKAVLRLEVTPHVVDNDLVKLEVMASNDEPDRTIVNSDFEPAIITRKTQTTVLLQNGQTTVIAGLSKEFTSEADSGIPVLKDLPYVGAMFRATLDEVELSDLLIFITPYIINPEGEEAETLRTDADPLGAVLPMTPIEMTPETVVEPELPVESQTEAVEAEESLPQPVESKLEVEVPEVKAPEVEFKEDQSPEPNDIVEKVI